MFITRGKTKSRTLAGPVFLLQEAQRPTTGPIKWSYSQPFRHVLGGTQITESDGNRWPPPKRGPVTDLGSEFYTRKQEVATSKLPWTTAFINAAGFPALRQIRGSLIANCFETFDQGTLWGMHQPPLRISFPPDLSSSRADLNVKGASAVAACSPVNQIANAASAVGELLQDVPKIPGTHLWEARLRALETVAAGGAEFLNVVFGLSPTLADMQSFLKGVHTVEKAVDQFIRDSGRSVRRSYVFPKERTISEEILPHRYSPAGWALQTAPNPDQAVGVVGAINYGIALPCYETIRTRVVERETWFDGAFTYHLPSWFDTSDKSDRRLLMGKLFGAQPDLNTLWQLAPWSWAVDWVTNAGSWVKNLQSLISYGTVLRYGYIMEKTTITDTYSAGKLVGLPDPSYLAVPGFKPPYPVVSPIVLRTTVKKRVQANPFGFGLSWDGLSSIQQAILAALAITRVVK